jgi:hypothetical protein
MNKKKEFDCVLFKEELHKKLLKKSGAKNIQEYIKYVNEAAKKSSLHKPRIV